MDQDLEDTTTQSPMTQNPLGASGFESAFRIGRDRDFVQPDAAVEAAAPVAQKPSVSEDEFFAERASRKAARLSNSIASVAGTNADAAAANQALGAQVGVSPGIAERNADEIKRRVDVLRMHKYDLLREDPILADFIMNDPKFASVAHDDIESLTAFGKILKLSGVQSFGDATAAPVPGFRRGLLLREMLMIQYGQREETSTQEQDARVIEIEKELADMPADEGFVASAGEIAGQISGGVPSILFRGAEGAAIGAAGGALGLGVGAAPGAIAGVGAGVAVGFAEEAFKLEAGGKYAEMIKSGFDRETALVGSLTYGAISASIEMLGAKVVTAPYRLAMRKAIATATVKTTAELVARPTAKAVVKSSLAHYFKSIAAETGTEVTQQILSIAVDEVALRYAESDLESRITTADGLSGVMDEVLHVAEKVAKGMSILSAVGGGVHYVSESRAVQESERSARVFKEIAENTKGSKLQLRDPSKREAFIASQASAAGVDTVYMRATDLIEVLKQDPITDSAMDEVLPGVREQIADAQKLGGSLNGVDVTIPMSVFATRLAGTKLGDKLVGLMRLKEDAVSAKDLPAFIEDQKQRQKEAEATMAERLKTDGKWVAEAQKIESDVVEALVSAGRDPDAAKVEAKFVQAIVVTGAAREGITPLQWVAKNALPRIAGTKDAAQGTTSQAKQAPAQGLVGQSQISNSGIVGLNIDQETLDYLAEPISEEGGSANFQAAWERGERRGTGKWSGSIPHHERGAGGAWTYGSMFDVRREALLDAIITGDGAIAGYTLSAEVPIQETFPNLTGDIGADYETANANGTVQSYVMVNNGGVITPKQIFPKTNNFNILTFGFDVENLIDKETKTPKWEVTFYNAEILRETQQSPAQGSFEKASIANVGTVTETMNSIRSKAIENAMATGVSKTKAAKSGQEAVQAWIDSNQSAYAKYKLDKDYQESAALQKATAETTAKIDSLLSEANDALISAGFVLERDQEGTSKSRYYKKGNLRVRVSDHEIPLTPERQYNRETMGEPWKDFVVAKENKRGVYVQEEKIAELNNWIAEQEAQGLVGQSQIAKMDSDYMAAVESGDVAEQQRMVDEATSSSGWYTAQHGTPTKQKISVFGNRGGLTGSESAKKAFFFSDRDGVTDTYRLFKRGVPNEKAINEWIDGLSPKELIRVLTRDVYFNPDKLNDAEEIAYVKDALKEEARKFNEEEGGTDNYVIDEIIQKAKNSSVPFPSEIDPKNIGQTLNVKLKITNPFYFTQEDAETFGMNAIVTKAIANGHDGVISSERVADSIANPDDKDPPSGIIYAVFNPEQIKSADPITRDESGKVVPLSRRFNLSSPNTFEQASRADLGLGQQAAFNEANYRPAVVAWAKEKFGDRTAPDGSTVWQNFTEWFGDSKVVDAEGKPMVVYHGTKKTFQTFKSTDPNGLIYFSVDPKFSERYASKSGGFKNPETDIQQRIDNARIAQKEITTPLYKELESKYKNLNDIPNEEYVAILEKGREIERSLLDGMTAAEADMRMGVRVIDAYIRASNIFDPTTMWEEFLPVITEVLARTGETPISNSMMEYIKNGHYLIWENKDVVDAVFQKYDAIKLRETMFGTFISGLDTIAVRDPLQVKSASANTGEFSKADPNILRQDAAGRIDAEYIAAVESGDMVAAQQMVDKAAKNAGYTVRVYHFTEASEFTQFDLELNNAGRGIWVTDSSVGWFGRRMDLFLKPGTIEAVKSQNDRAWKEGELSIETITSGDLGSISQRNIDTLKNSDAYRSDPKASGAVSSATIYVATDPAQVKSSAPVTRDESGNVIPLSQRFDQRNPNILRQDAVPATFYSALSVEVGKSTTKSASADSWKQQIKGLVAKGVVKEREVFWSGLNNWLDLQEGKVTKEQVQAFLAAGGVKVELTRLEDGGGQGNWTFDGDTYETEQDAEEAAGSASVQQAQDRFDGDSSINDSYLLMREGETIETFYDEDEARQALAELEDSENASIEERYELIIDGNSYGVYGDSIAAQQDADNIMNDWADAIRRDMDVSKVDDDDSNASKFSAYQLPGGTNYREVLVTLPRQEKTILELEKEMGFVRPLTNEQQDQVIAEWKQHTRSSKDFESSHWDQKNVLVHLRLNDRVDADGKKVLFVEEVQSDWGQAGREKGFAGETEIEIEKLIKQKAQAESDAEPYTSQGKDAPTEILDRWNFAANRIQSLRRQEVSSIPTAPFVETTSGWLELGLKQIMLEAVNGKYDRVAFVDGDQSVERYRKALTQAVDEVEIQRNDDGTYTYNANKGGGTIQREASVSAKRIGEVFGKAGSKQLLEQADANPESINTIASSDIEIGGEGMRKFYDTIVPQALNKMLKKLGGGKVENVNMITEKPVTQEQINAAERRRDFTESERLTAIYERQQLGRGISEKGDQQVGEQRGFAVTPALAEQVSQGLPLFQAAEGDARGSYDPVANLMRLGKNADQSTFAHELAHWYLVNQFNSASDPTASAQTKADADKTLVWFGIPGENLEQRLANWNAMSLDQQRKYHESFAYNWEIYLFEGRSPSVEMQSVFAMFKRWMTRVYISIRDDLNAVYRKNFGEDLPFLTDEIRAVFDRVLASEEQIQQQEAIDSIAATFSTQEESGMSNEEWGAYKAMEVEAHDQAVTDLTKASLRQMQWLGKARSRMLRELQARNETQRKQVRSEVAAEVGARPVYQAISLLKTGKATVANGTPVELKDGFKLNLEDVKKMVSAEDLLKFGFGKYGMVATDGMHPDMVAEMFGFKSGDELVLAILETKPLKEAIEEQTDKRMLAKYGGMQTAAELEAEVQKALHNEARARFVAVELRFLSKATQPVQMMLQAAKQIARKILGAKVIRSIRVSEYTSAEARSAKEASTAAKTPQSAETASKTAYTRSYNAQIAQGVEEAVAVEEATREASKARESAAKKIADHKKRHSGLTPAVVAIKEKQHQLIQHQLAKEAIDVKEEIEKAKIGFRKFFKTDERTAKTRDVDVVSIARSILAWYGFGKHGKSPAAYVAQLVAYNPALYEQLEPLITRSTDTGGSRDYRDLTVDEFRILRDSVEALWTKARRDKQIEIEGELLQLEDVVGELEKRVETIGVPEVVAGETSAPTRKERFGRALMHGKAMLRRVEHWADATDGAGNKGGPFTRYIFRPIQKSIDNYRQDRNKYVKRFVDLLAAVDLPVGKIQSGELNYTFGNGNGGIGKAEVLGALLHTGNESNFRKLILGRRWGTLDENGELDTSKWDTFLKRMIDEGVITKADFDFVQAVWDLNEEIKPIAQKAHHSLFGYYFQEVEATPLETPFGTYRGGYVPAKTDSFIVRDAARNAKMEELESDFRNSMPSTGMGFTKARKEYNEYLSLDVRLVASHINDVLRFAHVQPATKDVLRILKDRGFANRLSRIDATAIDDMLIPWLTRSARQSVSTKGMWASVDAFWRTVRSRTGMSIMFANVRNALQQTTGLFPASLKVESKYLKGGLTQYLANPRQLAREVTSMSKYMESRTSNQMFDLQEAMNDLLLNPSKYDKVKDWSSKHAYFMQMAMQNMVDLVAWTGAYNQAIVDIGPRMSEAKAQAEAVSRADAAVRLTQGSMAAEGISQFEVGTPAYRIFVQFTGYFNMMANLNADELTKVFRDLGWRGNKGKLFAIYLLGFALPALVSDAIVRTLGGTWDDDDDDGYLDDFAAWFFGSQIRAGAAMLPFGSSVATALTAGFTDATYDDRISSSPAIGALEASTVGVAKAAINVIDEDRDVTGKNVRDVLTLVSLVTGVPVTALGKPIGYVVDAERGAIEPTSPTDFVRGLVTGVASEPSKNR